MEEKVIVEVARAAEIEIKDDTIVVVLSDESVDRHGTKFLVDGWRLDYAQRNGVMTFGHPAMDSTDDTLYIGRYTPFIEDSKLKARIEFNLDNPRAVRIEKAVRNGFIKMTSIRAHIHDADWDDPKNRDVLVYKDQTLFDFGIVPHGSNQNAYVEQRAAVIEIFKLSEVVEEKPDVEETEDRYDVAEFTKMLTRTRNIITKINKTR